MIAGIAWYVGKVIALATVTLAAVLLISSTESSIPDLFVVALVWRALALAIEWFKFEESG